MLFWLVPIILLMIVLSISSVGRLTVPRDIGQEGTDDRDSILAYDKIGHWPLFTIIRFFVIRQLKCLHPQGIVIDAGCGPGHLALAVAQKFPSLQIEGIDISPEMLERARINRAALNLEQRVKFQVADVLHLPIADRAIDFTISTLSLHHWREPGPYIEEIYRTLKPEGQLLIFDLRRDSPRILFDIVRFCQRFMAPPPIRRVNGGPGSILSSFTPLELEMILSASSFREWKVLKRWGWVYVWGKK